MKKTGFSSYCLGNLVKAQSAYMGNRPSVTPSRFYNLFKYSFCFYRLYFHFLLFLFFFSLFYLRVLWLGFTKKTYVCVKINIYIFTLIIFIFHRIEKNWEITKHFHFSKCLNPNCFFYGIFRQWFNKHHQRQYFFFFF